MRLNAAFRGSFHRPPLPSPIPLPDHSDLEGMAVQLTERLWHSADKAPCIVGRSCQSPWTWSKCTDQVAGPLHRGTTLAQVRRLPWLPGRRRHYGSVKGSAGWASRDRDAAAAGGGPSRTSGSLRCERLFTWRDPAIPDAAPPEILAVWKEMTRLSEARAGRPGLEIVEVDLIQDARRRD